MKRIDISGPKGNAYFLLGLAEKYLRQIEEASGRIGYTEAILGDMKSSDYDNLLKVFNEQLGMYVRLSSFKEIPNVNSDLYELMEPEEDEWL